MKPGSSKVSSGAKKWFQDRAQRFQHKMDTRASNTRSGIPNMGVSTVRLVWGLRGRTTRSHMVLFFFEKQQKHRHSQSPHMTLRFFVAKKTSPTRWGRCTWLRIRCTSGAKAGRCSNKSTMFHVSAWLHLCLVSMNIFSCQEKVAIQRSASQAAGVDLLNGLKKVAFSRRALCDFGRERRAQSVRLALLRVLRLLRWSPAGSKDSTWRGRRAAPKWIPRPPLAGRRV